MKLVLALLVTIAACGDNATLPPDAARPDGPGPFMTAPHTPLPLVAKHSGTILQHVKLVTLTYSDYPAASRAAVEGWGDAIVGSSWYQTVGAEYGVMSGTHAAKIQIGPAPTTTLEDVAIEAKIKALVMAGTVPPPLATGNQFLYMIYIPSTVPLGMSLAGILGYHQMTTLNGIKFPFAVVLDDGNVDDTTVTASHELIEAATDPMDPPIDGYYSDPPLPDPWNLILGEVGDLCNDEPFEHESGFAVQRSWSNAAAMAGQAPCVPNEHDPWMTVTAQPATMPTIPAGGTATFTLTGWSTAPQPDWQIKTYAADYSDLTDADMAATLSTTLINNGTTSTLTLHAPTTAMSGQHGGVYVLSGPAHRPWAVGFTVQ